MWSVLLVALVFAESDPPVDPQEHDDDGAAEAEAWTLVRREVTSRLLIDTRFDATGEDVLEWWNAGRLALDHRRGDVRAFAEARVRWGVVGEDPGRPFLIANVDEPKWTGEVDLREVFVRWRRHAWEIKVGQLIFVWGKNELFAAADLLNPIDARYDPLAGLDALKDARVPTFSIDAGFFSASAGVELVMLPFFSRHRAFVLGRDFALAAPGSPLAADLAVFDRLDPSIEDTLQDGVSGTEIPDESPQNATLALRATSRSAGVDWAVTAIYGWDRTPRLRIDHDLRTLLLAAPAILADPTLLFLDPDLSAANQRLLAKVQANAEVLRVRYRRMTRLAVEAQGVLGRVVARADVGFSPGQTFYTTSLRPLWKNVVQAAVGFESMGGETWYLSLTGFGLAVFRVPHSERLLMVEPTSVTGAERDTALFYGGAATGRRRWDDVDVEAQATALYTSSRDLVMQAQITYDGIESHEILAGVVLISGVRTGAGGLFDGNDLVFLAYRAVW